MSTKIEDVAWVLRWNELSLIDRWELVVYTYCLYLRHHLLPVERATALSFALVCALVIVVSLKACL